MACGYERRDVRAECRGTRFRQRQARNRAMAQVATDGTLRIIKSAEKAGVKRVVMTGNFGAVGFSNKDPQHITTESDWTDPDEPGLSLYERSKLVAEKAAWNYLKTTNSALEFTTVTPARCLVHPWIITFLVVLESSKIYLMDQ